MEQKSIKKNTIYSILRTVSSIIFPIITFPYITRVLLAENIGKINFGLSIVSYFSLIASLGTTTYAIRECSVFRDDKEKLGLVASQIWSINIISTFISYIGLFLILIFWKKIENYRVLIIIQSLSIIATTLGADWLNSAMEDFKYITIRSIIFQFVSVFLMFIFVRESTDYIKYAIISLFSSVGASVVNIWYRKRYCNLVFTKNMELKRHMGPILYLLVMLLAQTIFNSVDTTMLGIFKGDYEVGIYTAAHKVLNILQQTIGAILWVIMPRMSYYFAEKKYEEINVLLRKLLGFNILLGLPCATGCFILAEDIIRVLSGDSFLEAVPVLQIFMIGFIISLFGGSFLGNAILLPSKQEKYYMYVCCFSALINILGNYLLIPFFGAKAAAGTTSLCSLIIFILLRIKVDKNIKIKRIGNIVFSPIIGCFFIVIICIITRLIKNLWIRVIISLMSSILIYGIIQILMKNELIQEVFLAIKNKNKS